jgi:hypothetical protein
VQCIPNSKEVVVYYDATNTIIRKTLEFAPLLGIPNFLDRCGYLNANGKLYISGGILRNAPSESFIMLDPNTNTITKLSDMNTGRFSHSMFYHNDTIFAIGGQTNNCEKYDTKTMKWIKLSSLVSDDRMNSVLYVYNNFLYAFFGMVKGDYSDTIERLNLKNVKSKWEVVPYQKNQKDMDLKMFGCGIIEESDKEIYLFGGKSSTGLRKNAVKFDFSNNTFSPTEIVLDDGTYFQESLLIELNESSFGQFNLDKNENFLKIQLA